MADSDDEYDVIDEMDILCAKIQKAGFKVDRQKDEEIRKSIKAHESRDVRIKKWNYRVARLQKLLDATLPEISGGLPGASVIRVAASCAPSLAKGHALPTITPPRSKLDKNCPSLSCFLGYGDQPPVTAAIHVKFVEMGVALLRQKPAMPCAEMIEEWNKHHTKDWNTVVRATSF
jgi:hypothetical protein